MSSTGSTEWFNVGDVLMLQLYDGTVKSIPGFTIQAPNLTVPTNGAVPSSTVAYTMNSQFQTSGSVISTELYFDDGSLTGGAGDQSGSNPFMTSKILTCTTNAPPADDETQHCTVFGHGVQHESPSPTVPPCDVITSGTFSITTTSGRRS